jgi:hypothetical protein
MSRQTADSSDGSIEWIELTKKLGVMGETRKRKNEGKEPPRSELIAWQRALRKLRVSFNTPDCYCPTRRKDQDGQYCFCKGSSLIDCYLDYHWRTRRGPPHTYDKVSNFQQSQLKRHPRSTYATMTPNTSVLLALISKATLLAKRTVKNDIIPSLTLDGGTK